MKKVMLAVLAMLAVLMLAGSAQAQTPNNRMYLPNLGTIWGWEGTAYIECSGRPWFSEWEIRAVYPDEGGLFYTTTDNNGHFFVPKFGHEYAFVYVEEILVGRIDDDHLIFKAIPSGACMLPEVSFERPAGPQPLRRGGVGW